MECRKEMERNSSLTHLDTDSIKKEDNKKGQDNENSDFTGYFRTFETEKKGSERTKEEQQIYEEEFEDEIGRKSGLILYKKTSVQDEYNENNQNRKKMNQEKQTMKDMKQEQQIEKENNSNIRKRNIGCEKQLHTENEKEIKNKNIETRNVGRNRKTDTINQNRRNTRNNDITQENRIRKKRVSYRLFINIKEKQVDITMTTYLALILIFTWILTIIYKHITIKNTLTIITMEGIKFTMPANDHNYKIQWNEQESYLLLPVNQTKMSEKIHKQEIKKKENEIQHIRILRYIRIRKDLKDLLLSDICDAPLIRWFCMTQIVKKTRRRKTN